MTPRPSSPSSPKCPTTLQRAPMRSQTAPVNPPRNHSALRLRSDSSANFVRPPSRAGPPAPIERQAHLRTPEENRIRRDTAAVGRKITYNYYDILRALDSVVKSAHKESERICYDLQRLASIVESETAIIIKDAAVLEKTMRREEARIARDLRSIRQIQGPRKIGPELDRLEATLEEGEKQTAHEYSRLQTARNAEESAASALIQARRNEESRLARDLQRLHNARADSRKRENEELASLGRRVLKECDLPPLHTQIQSLRERQKELGVQLDAAFAAFATQSSKTNAEIDLEARRVTELRREKERALDDEMLRLTKVRSDCQLRDAEIRKFITARRTASLEPPSLNLRATRVLARPVITGYNHKTEETQTPS